MIKKLYLTIAAFFCCIIPVAAQGFFNLTAEQVRIDSVLPAFTYQYPVGTHYNDSIYSVSIAYPEYIDMTPTDIARYHQITTDSLPAVPVINSYMTIDRKRGVLDVSFVPLVYRDGKYQKLVSFMLKVKGEAVHAYSIINKANAVSTRTSSTASTASSRYASHSKLSTGNWAKIRVSESGIYELTDAVIRKAGFTDLSKVRIYGYGGALVPEVLTDAYLTQYDDLPEVKTYTNGSGKRLFHAQGPVSWNGKTRVRNPYSDYGYYLITQGDDTPEGYTSDEFKALCKDAGENYNSLYEVDDYTWFSGGRRLYDATTFSKGTSKEYTLAGTGTSSTGTLTVAYSAKLSTSDNITADVTVNGTSAGTMSIKNSDSYASAADGSKTFTVKNLKAQNTVKVTFTSGSSEEMHLDYISLYSDTVKAFPDLESSTFSAAEYVYNITNQDYHSHGAVDMVIIVPTSRALDAQAQRLKTLHETHDGLSVRIVYADELYNEFSSGTPDASAYKRYMKMLYDRATTDSELPKYLVLFGDGSFDNRMHTSAWSSYSPDDFLLCYESENSFSEVYCYVSDDFYCLLDDGEDITGYRGKPDVAVGRYPVRTTTEATTMIDKLETYNANTYAGDWQNTIVMMGDDGNSNVHMQQAENVAKIIEANYPAYDVKRVMWDAYTRTTTSTGNRYPEVASLLKGYMTNGALIMNYSGHGSPYQISHEAVLMLSDFKETTSNHLPLWFTASCDIMPFDGQTENIGEAAIFNQHGGAISFYGTTRTVITTANEKMNTAFTRYVMNPSYTVGEAVRLAKNNLVTSGTELTVNKLQYTLLGDPALSLARPTKGIKIDSIAGKAATSIVSLKAGDVVVVKGHVTPSTAVADSLTTFNGKLTATVFDVESNITCKMNDVTVTNAFTFKDYDKILYNGSNSVKNGAFTFSFVVPKDITYSDANARIIAYAVNDSATQIAHGQTTNLSFNGTGNVTGDKMGPNIYCYLNSNSFSNGDNVNPTPYFIANISDESGLNTTGNGIGHDLTLIIDNDPNTTYVLNNKEYFTYDQDSYKSGTAEFSIPELSTGSHQLLFRAWDTMNNMSEAQLNFNVVNGLNPDVYDVELVENPVTSIAKFRIIHNRTGCSLDVKLDIFDMSGRMICSKSETGVASDNSYTMTWDLCSSDGGALSTGIYLYRVRMSCDGSGYTSKSKKMIVIRQ